MNSTSSGDFPSQRKEGHLILSPEPFNNRQTSLPAGPVLFFFEQSTQSWDSARIPTSSQSRVRLAVRRPQSRSLSAPNFHGVDSRFSSFNSFESANLFPLTHSPHALPDQRATRVLPVPNRHFLISLAQKPVTNDHRLDTKACNIFVKGRGF